MYPTKKDLMVVATFGVACIGIGYGAHSVDARARPTPTFSHILQSQPHLHGYGCDGHPDKAIAIGDLEDELPICATIERVHEPHEDVMYIWDNLEDAMEMASRYPGCRSVTRVPDGHIVVPCDES